MSWIYWEVEIWNITRRALLAPLCYYTSVFQVRTSQPSDEQLSTFCSSRQPARRVQLFNDICSRKFDVANLGDRVKVFFISLFHFVRKQKLLFYKSCSGIILRSFLIKYWISNIAILSRPVFIIRIHLPDQYDLINQIVTVEIIFSKNSNLAQNL